ncbi:MAG: TrmH family RNA methyltransferase [Clostridia bacterium]|nr:TrmH family RNA methyltransferase [Clostridia bacterium]
MENLYTTQDMRVKPYKKEFTYSYTEGVFPTVELIENAPDTVVKVLVSSKSNNNTGVALLKEKCCALNIPFKEDDNTIARICPKGSVMAVGVFMKRQQKLNMKNKHIVLVNPADMGNLGTILRTAAAFSFFDIAIIEPAADCFDPKTIRASMGAFFRVRIYNYKSFEEYAEEAGERDYFPFMLKGRDLEQFTPEKTPNRPCSLIFGNESRGLDDGYLEVGTPLCIRHLNTVDSLNLTIAAGIAMHWQFHTFNY